MNLINKLLTKLVPYPKILDAERILVVSPHPDDAEVAMGATIARLASLGKVVKIVIATDGRYGSQEDKFDTDAMVETRRVESLESAKILGVEVEFLGFRDGGLYDENEIRIAIQQSIVAFKPDIVFCPDPCLRTECHPDHIKVGRASLGASTFCAYPMINADLTIDGKADIKGVAMYYTDSPNQYLKVGKKDISTQKLALQAHKSQMAGASSDAFSQIWVYLMFRSYRLGLRSLKGRAEGFRVLSTVHMHCCAEKL